MTLTFHQWPWIKVMIKVMVLPWVQCEHSDLDYLIMTLNEGHDTSLGPGQQSSEILFKFIKRIKSYCPDYLFDYVVTIMCIVTLTLDQ
jgi:hypothetical protein